MTKPVSLAIDNHLALVQLNRPGKHNAVNLEMFDELAAVSERIAANKSVRAVVLSGAGENFCAGIDTSVFSAGDLAALAQRMAPVDPSPANVFQRAAYAWRELPVPVVCALTGVAFGAGLQIAMGADLRYASPTVRMSIMEGKWGLMPDMAISATARGVLRPDIVRELAYTGRVVEATEAFDLGLVTSVVVNPLARATEVATEIAAKSPDAIRAMKRLFVEGWTGSEADSLALEAALQSGLMGGKNQLEAVQANLQKRPPSFSD